MTWFEPRFSGVGSDRSTNGATTTWIRAKLLIIRAEAEEHKELDYEPTTLWSEVSLANHTNHMII